MTTQSYSKQHKERPDLGPCPKCAAAGYEARLRLYKGKTKGDNPRQYEFAACEMGKEACGYTQAAKNGKLIALTYCPDCQQALKPITKKDGSHALRCDNCDLWILADKAFNIVEPPKCPECGADMAHRAKKDHPDEYFWACFEHQEFRDSDKYGKFETEQNESE